MLAVAAALLVAVTIISGYPLPALMLALAAYLSYELLLSDHLFYPPRCDYRYNLDNAKRGSARIDNGQLLLAQPLDNDCTALAELQISATAGGFIFDPYIEIGSGTTTQRQYFERGAGGRRYLNISHLPAAERISLKPRHCRIPDGEITLYRWRNPALEEKKILILAPHADDAEIAAFALYRRHDCFIATVSAGEVEADHYLPLCGDAAEAALLKGRLRAWDSVTVPRWGGVDAENCVQLGYFCKTIGQMYRQRDTALTSLAGAGDDIRVFRAFNSQQLPSDTDGRACWDNLVADITHLLTSVQADIVVTPHPLLDPHPDHVYTSVACAEALRNCRSAATVLLYANHHHYSDMFPFGSSGSIASLPPRFAADAAATAPFSLACTADCRRDKTMALAMMHDLRTPLKKRKALRRHLQQLLLGRDSSPYAADDFIRKAVRANELFYSANGATFAAMCAEAAGQP